MQYISCVCTANQPIVHATANDRNCQLHTIFRFLPEYQRILEMVYLLVVVIFFFFGAMVCAVCLCLSNARVDTEILVFGVRCTCISTSCYIGLIDPISLGYCCGCFWAENVRNQMWIWEMACWIDHEQWTTKIKKQTQFVDDVWFIRDAVIYFVWPSIDQLCLFVWFHSHSQIIITFFL